MRITTKISFAITAMLLACLATVANAGINDGLMAHYCFDNPADLGKDCSGNNNNGTAEGTVTAVTGYKGGGALFGGMDNPADIHVPNSDSLKFSSALSISYAVKLNSLVGMPGDEFATNQAIVAKSHDATGFIVLASNPNASPADIVMAFGNHDAKTVYPMSGSTGTQANWSPANVDKWIHVIFTLDNVNGIARTYFNGKLVRTETKAAFDLTQPNRQDFTMANTQDLYIGKYSDVWYPLNGVVDELRFYNRVLTSSEVTALSNQGGAVSGTIKRLGSHTVTCKNNTTGQIVNIPASKATPFDCEAYGLKYTPFVDTVTISISGKPY